ncbi:MAG: sigma-54-dependent Fis family transcriptional regulator [Planctomycetales bacterium]|nr:sigma-54-dependent Fis family transcriptional regulator [Planctomycetales bacterium]
MSTHYPQASRAPRRRVAVIDDDPNVPLLLRGLLDSARYEVVSAGTGAAGIDLVRAQTPFAVVLDGVLPDVPGLEVLEQLRDVDDPAPILFVPARATGSAPIEAMRRGAFELLLKPFDAGAVRQAVATAVRHCESSRERNTPPQEGKRPAIPSEGVAHDEPLVGQSAAMLEVFKAIGRCSTGRMPILLIGEPGVGKETVAHLLHAYRGCMGPYLSFHCPAYSADQVTSELFGLEGGGLWHRASGGTLVIQDVGRLPLLAQTQLAALLQQPEAAGAPTPPCLVATSADDLESLVVEGRFRSDLYYLLSSGRIDLPALRRRLEDLPLLVERFLADAARELNVEPMTVSAEAIAALASQPWPGNLDELRGVLRRMAMDRGSGGGELPTLSPVPARESSVAAEEAARGDDGRYRTDWREMVDRRLEAGSTDLYAECLAEAERKIFCRLLEHTQGNQAQASRILGISRATLRKKLRVLGIETDV